MLKGYITIHNFAVAKCLAVFVILITCVMDGVGDNDLLGVACAA